MIAKTVMLFGQHPISIFTLLLLALIIVAWWILSAYRGRQHKQENLSWRKHLNAIRPDHDTRL